MENYVQSLTLAAISELSVQNGRCFMCGSEASSGLGEHVFPLWLQHRFSLLDERLTLLNGTLIPYRRLTSPCCEACNTGPLAHLESRISSFQQMPDLACPRNRASVGQWLLKIFLGILHAECRFSRDRRNPSLGSILPPKYIEELKTLHLVINSCRKDTVFQCLHGPYPFTVYMYRITESRHFDPFDFSTNLSGQSISIRMGALGIIAVADGGLQMHVGRLGPYGLDGQELHPLQFAEITARVHYKSMLRDATHFYVNSETEDLLCIEQVRVQSFTKTRLKDGSQTIFDQWDEEAAGKAMRHYTRINTDWYSHKDRRTYTFTLRNDGSHNTDFSGLDAMLDSL